MSHSSERNQSPIPKRFIVYKATNTVNGKVYIGQTRNGLDKRRRQHICDARNNRFDCYFHRALRKYGEDSFDWEVIDSTDDVTAIDDLEKQYIAEYDSFNNKKGYNTTSGGGSGYEFTSEECQRRSERVRGEKNPMYGVPSPNTGKTFTDEHRQKIRDALKNRPHDWHGGIVKCNKPVINLTTGEKYDSLAEACEICGINRRVMQRHLNRTNVNTIKGCIWELLENVDLDNFEPVIPTPSMFKSKFVKCLRIDDNSTWYYSSIQSAASDLGFCRRTISRCLKASTPSEKQHHGYLFEWVSRDDVPDISQVIETNQPETVHKFIYHVESQHHFESWAELERTFGYSHKTIRRAFSASSPTGDGDHFIVYETTTGVIEQDTSNVKWNANQQKQCPMYCPELNILFESAPHASIFFGYSTRHLSELCESNEPMRRNGYTIRRVDENEDVSSYGECPVLITAHRDSSVSRYDCFADACLDTGLCRKQIKQSASRGEPVNDIVFEIEYLRLEQYLTQE